VGVTLDARPELLLLSDHPSLHRGFATVGREVASHLFRTGAWNLRYVGYYPPDPAWSSPGYPVLRLDETDGPRELRVPRLRLLLSREIVLQPQRTPAKPILLCFGTPFDLQCVVEALREERLRSRVRLVGYTPIDYAPLPVQMIDLLGEFDRLVPYTRFAHDAIEDCARRAGAPTRFLAEPVPHGVDATLFQPLPPAERTEVRRQLFGLGGGELLIGYFGRNSGNKRVDVVLRLFHLVASGCYAVCARCGNTSAGGLDREGRPLAPPARCHACESDGVTPGRRRDDVRLYLHTDLAAHEAGEATGGRDLGHIARCYGIGERVQLRADIRIGRGDSQAELARRMGACDLHLLPYELAGWELTVLETAACGVANVITEVSAPPEYAAPFARVVPVGSYVIDDDVRGTIDTDLALRAILELLDDPVARRELAQRGPRVAREYDWSRVGPMWAERLARESEE
jgi:glycosyltransferase involved in cell wall biosynthesis